VRRRVKEQQKRIGAAEFRNTHFSYTLGAEASRSSSPRPELQSQAASATSLSEWSDLDAEPRRAWTSIPACSARSQRRARQWRPRAEQPCAAAFKESIRCAEQNLYARAMQLVGDRDPRAHEFSVQLRGFDAAKSGPKQALPV
jgi:ATP-dependent Lon protease